MTTSHLSLFNSHPKQHSISYPQEKNLPEFLEQKAIIHTALITRFQEITDKENSKTSNELLFTLGCPALTCTLSKPTYKSRHSLFTVPEDFPHTHIQSSKIEFRLGSFAKKFLDPHIEQALKAYLYKISGSNTPLYISNNTFSLEIRNDQTTPAQATELIVAYLKVFFLLASLEERNISVVEQPTDLVAQLVRDEVQSPSHSPYLIKKQLTPLFFTTIDDEIRFEKDLIRRLKRIGEVHVHHTNYCTHWSVITITVPTQKQIVITLGNQMEASPIEVQIYTEMDSLITDDLSEYIHQIAKRHKVVPEKLQYTYFSIRDRLQTILENLKDTFENEKNLLCEEVSTYIHMILYFRGDFGPIFGNEQPDSDIDSENQLDSQISSDILEESICKKPKGMLQHMYAFFHKHAPAPLPRKRSMQQRNRTPLAFRATHTSTDIFALEHTALARAKVQGPINTYLSKLASRRAIALSIQDRDYLHAAQFASEMGLLSEARYYFLKFYDQIVSERVKSKYQQEIIHARKVLKGEKSI